MIPQRPARSTHVLTTHAARRFIERVHGIDIGRIAAVAGVDPHDDAAVMQYAGTALHLSRAHIERLVVTPAVRAAIALGALRVDLGNGHHAVLAGGVVVTVTPNHKDVQRRRELWKFQCRRAERRENRRQKAQRGRNDRGSHDYATAND